jgi:hypothetical protein
VYRKPLYVIPWAMLGLIGVYVAAGYGLNRLVFSLKGVTESPNGNYRIFDFQSSDDGSGHAPYGTNLSLTRNRHISSPDDGYVIFGGYCKTGARVEWKSDAHITVYCEQVEPAKTQVVRAYGIDIEYAEVPARSNNSLQGRRP